MTSAAPFAKRRHHSALRINKEVKQSAGKLLSIKLSLVELMTLLHLKNIKTLIFLTKL